MSDTPQQFTYTGIEMVSSEYCPPGMVFLICSGGNSVLLKNVHLELPPPTRWQLVMRFIRERWRP